MCYVQLNPHNVPTERALMMTVSIATTYLLPGWGRVIKLTLLIQDNITPLGLGRWFFKSSSIIIASLRDFKPNGLILL